MTETEAPEKNDETPHPYCAEGDLNFKENLIVGTDYSESQVLLFLENVSG